MATILPFVIRPGARPAPRLCAGDAAIVIFPGVRYEPSQASTQGKIGANAPRKRKDKSS